MKLHSCNSILVMWDLSAPYLIKSVYISTEHSNIVSQQIACMPIKCDAILTENCNVLYK